AAQVAQAVGALFQAQRAKDETSGKEQVLKALDFLRQTLALLQQFEPGNQGLDRATASVAQAMGLLYPLSIQEVASPRGDATVKLATEEPADDAAARARAEAEAAERARLEAEAAERARLEAEAAEKARAEAEAAERQKAAAKPAVSPTPLKRPADTGRSEEREANIGVNTETNFYTGFTGEIRDGGVFLATYH